MAERGHFAVQHPSERWLFVGCEELVLNVIDLEKLEVVTSYDVKIIDTSLSCSLSTDRYISLLFSDDGLTLFALFFCDGQHRYSLLPLTSR